MEPREIKWRSPLAAFAPLAHRDGAILLHGGEASIGPQWSFIAADPQTIISSVGGVTFVDGVQTSGSPFEALAKAHARRRAAQRNSIGSPFAAGIAGFCGYECGAFLEPTAKGPLSTYDLPDCYFGAYDAVAAFDRLQRKAYLLGPSNAARDSLWSILGSDDLTTPSFEFDRPTSNFSRDSYIAAVDDVIGRIRNGDLFQANISHRIETRSQSRIDAFSLFRAGSAISSSEFGAFMCVNGAHVVSLSPERFFSVAAQPSGQLKIVAEPIKGTRPRGFNEEDDKMLRAALVADPKDRAENIMIADLMRNDLSKICEDHSIREEAICEAVTHASVHHLVSRISGVLRPGLGAVEALAALFPCGSVTGAPKVEAMKVIAALENSGRGPYCGAIGYMDDAGDADFSVAIRIAIVEKNRLSIPVGGGVTFRSDPGAEYEETLAKARQFLRIAGLQGSTLP